MSPVVTVALPVFAVIGAGFLAGRFKLASGEDCTALNRFVFRFGFPAALFALMSVARGFTSADIALGVSYGLAAMIVIIGAYAFARFLLRATPQEAGAHAFASTIGNAVFLGLPIALGIEGWPRPFVTLMLVEGILVIGIGASLMAPRRAGEGLLPLVAGFFIRPLKNPLVIGAVAGVAVASLGFELPGPMRAFFEMIGRAAGPVALFSLGLFFATRPAPTLRGLAGRTLSIALFKMGLLPLLSFALISLFSVDEPTYLGALALFTATPTAVGAFVMASQYGRYVEETVSAIAVTTALSLLSIGAVLLVFA